ncbi:MAG: HU family DNA-binding protein [Patescibacteria group bacterium]
MNKAELGAKIAERLSLPKKTGEEVIEIFEELVTVELMNGGEVTIAGFGTFSARKRAGRKGVNPQKPTETIDIPAVVVPKFKAGKALKDSLKGKRKVNSSTPAEPPSQPAA